MSIVLASRLPYVSKKGESYLSRCRRDKHGRCLPANESGDSKPGKKPAAKPDKKPAPKKPAPKKPTNPKPKPKKKPVPKKPAPKPAKAKPKVKPIDKLPTPSNLSKSAVDLYNLAASGGGTEASLDKLRDDILKLKKPDLVKVAEAIGMTVPGGWTKSKIADAVKNRISSRRGSSQRVAISDRPQKSVKYNNDSCLSTIGGTETKSGGTVMSIENNLPVRKAGESYFAHCDRDEHGQCKPESGGGSSGGSSSHHEMSQLLTGVASASKMARASAAHGPMKKASVGAANATANANKATMTATTKEDHEKASKLHMQAAAAHSAAAASHSMDLHAGKEGMGHHIRAHDLHVKLARAHFDIAQKS